MAAPLFVIAFEDAAAAALYGPARGAAAPRGDAGVDLRLPRDLAVEPGAVAVAGLGVRARCLVDGAPSAFWLLARSSIARTPLSLANGAGLIDAGYTGEIKAALRNHGGGAAHVAAGTALVQLAAPSLASPEVLFVLPGSEAYALHFGATARGGGGFGSTGVAGAQ